MALRKTPRTKHLVGSAFYKSPQEALWCAAVVLPKYNNDYMLRGYIHLASYRFRLGEKALSV